MLTAGGGVSGGLAELCDSVQAATAIKARPTTAADTSFDNSIQQPGEGGAKATVMVQSLKPIDAIELGDRIGV
jgi:hypothetical protein